MSDLGWVIPDANGKWKWPFATMLPGDSFKVAPELRLPGSVRSMAYNRGSQLGRSFSVKAQPDGSMLVRRVDGAGDPTAPQWLLYGLLRDRLQALYGIDADALPWGMLDGRLELASRAEGLSREMEVRCLVASAEHSIQLRQDGIAIEPRTAAALMEE